MLLKYFYDSSLAQASYMVGCAKTGQALLVDPSRDVQMYLDVAAQEGLRITHVTETHIHADFVSGTRELAARSGAQIYLSDTGDADWKYRFPASDTPVLLRDGDSWMVGNIKVEVIATPGHTPEHIVFLITDTAGADAPMGIFSGDFLFVGDVGRPDLLEEAAGVRDSKTAAALQQFQSLARCNSLPDYLQIWPGHGAGSACGKALGAIPSTTLGYERRFNPALQFTDEDRFVEWLLADQPEPPRYFAHMKQVNKLGPTLLCDLAVPAELDRPAIDAALADDGLVIDLRSPEAFAAGHIPGCLNVPMSAAMYSTYVGWFVDFSRPTYLVLPDGAQLATVLRTLRAIGVDDIPGYLPEAALGDKLVPLPTVDLDAFKAALRSGESAILDVRGKSEYNDEHLPGALHIPLGFLPRYLATLPHDRRIMVHCASGYRAQIATSLLHRHGITNAATLVDSQGRWKELIS